MSLEFKQKLRDKMDKFVDAVFAAAADFPKVELYVTTAQLKRAALSVLLNYVEGYARFRPKVQVNFWETSFGSLKETTCLIVFSERHGYLTGIIAKELLVQADEIAAMLWSEIEGVKN